jgi:uncharacterized membrane protein
MEMIVNQSGIIQKIKLKYEAAIGTIVAIMERAYQNQPTRIILKVLVGLVLMILGVFLLGFAGFIQRPSEQGMQTLNILLISYFVTVCIFIVIVIAYNEFVFKKVKRGIIDENIDKEKLEQLKSQIIEEIDNSTITEK